MPQQHPTPERLAQLNAGTVQTAHLMERLAVDMPALLKTVLPDLQVAPFAPKTGFTKKMLLCGQAVYVQYGFAPFEMLRTQHADSLRDVACYLLKFHDLPLAEKLTLMQPLADDEHFGVREWAWLALRDDIISNLDEALTLLQQWTKHGSENVRRFTTEATRPRGVWCPHITALRQEPWRALPLLTVLKNDPARYVQLSVGNWLNDAGKDHSEWVKKICAEWKAESRSTHTSAIVKRALRNLQ